MPETLAGWGGICNAHRWLGARRKKFSLTPNWDPIKGRLWSLSYLHPIIAQYIASSLMWFLICHVMHPLPPQIIATYWHWRLVSDRTQREEFVTTFRLKLVYKINAGNPYPYIAEYDVMLRHRSGQWAVRMPKFCCRSLHVAHALCK